MSIKFAPLAPASLSYRNLQIFTSWTSSCIVKAVILYSLAHWMDSVLVLASASPSPRKCSRPHPNPGKDHHMLQGSQVYRMATVSV